MGEMFQTPGAFFGQLKDRIPREQRLAFLSTVIIGFCCHLFIFTNSMCNNDNIRYLYVTFDKPELGRWLQTYFAGISSYFSLPVVNGLLAIIYTGLAAMVITAIFRIRSSAAIVLVGGILVTFPTMACLLSFTFAADPFMLACALACLAGYFVTVSGFKHGWLLGAFFLCISVAIYQAYLPFTLLIMLLYYLLLLTEDREDGFLIKKGLSYISMLAVGMGSYYIGMQATLKIKDISLSDYQGVGDSSLPGFRQLLTRMHTALIDFIDFFRGNQVLALNGWLKAGLILSLLVIAGGYIALAVRSGLFKKPLRILLMLVTAACVPFAVNVIWLISDGVNYHILMRHAWCLLFVAALVIAERCGEILPIKGRALITWGAFFGVTLMVWNYIILSNIGYFNMNFRYEKTYALCLKILNRLESMEDYDRHRPIAFVGRYNKVYSMEEVEFLLDPMAGMKGELVFAEGSRNFGPFFKNMLGEDIEVVSPDIEKEFHDDPRFIEMPRFPAEGSIKVIDDITVVKLNE